MKKIILYPLLAFLLICFLSACVSEANDPTPIPETTSGQTAAGTTAEPTPDETTTEPVEITSDEPMETTAEITTQQPETTYALMSESDTYGLIYFIMIPVEDTAGSETDDTPAKVADTETPWYITEWETAKEITEKEVPTELQSYALRVPKEYGGIANGFAIKVEFFQEYYRIGDQIQFRVTIENTGTQCVEIGYSAYPTIRKPYFAQISAGTTLFNPTDRIGTLSFSLFKTEQQMEEVISFYMYDAHIRQPYWNAKFRIYPKHTAQEDVTAALGHTQPVLGSVTLECSVSCNPQKVDPEKVYHLWLSMLAEFPEETLSDGYHAGGYFRLPIPVEFVEVEFVPAQ